MKKDIRNQLERLLRKSKAPISGKKIACYMLGARNREYFGYNTETKKEIIHAEERALKIAKKDAILREIYLMSGGSFMDIKHAIPCEECSKIISSHLISDSKVILHSSKVRKKFVLNFREIEKAYKSFSSPLRFKKGNLLFFLKKTNLTKIDRDLVSSMCKGVIKYNNRENSPISFFMTGSSSGRGGPKSLLAKKITGVSYWDLDFLLISKKKNPRALDDLIKNIYKSSLKLVGYGNDSILSKNMPSYKLEEGDRNLEDFYFRKAYYTKKIPLEIKPPYYKKSKSIPSSIDVSVGKCLNGIITNNYLKKNWYLRLV